MARSAICVPACHNLNGALSALQGCLLNPKGPSAMQVHKPLVVKCGHSVRHDSFKSFSTCQQDAAKQAGKAVLFFLHLDHYFLFFFVIFVKGALYTYLHVGNRRCFVCRFADRIEPHKDRIPEEARRVIEEEMAKLSGLESASSEFNVTRNYLDWLTAIPWGHYTQERLDIQHAQKVNPYLSILYLTLGEVTCGMNE